MAKNKRKVETPKFTHLNLPAEVLARRDLSMIEKIIICDIGYFNGNGFRGYTISNTNMAKKFGCSRRTIINAIGEKGRLRSPKLKLVINCRQDDYHRCLKLNGEISALFNGERIAPPEPRERFEKPTADQVTEYAKSIDFELDGQNFVDYYQSRGWMIGKNKMRDWKAAVRNWQNRRRQESGNGSKSRRDSEPACADIR